MSASRKFTSYLTLTIFLLSQIIPMVGIGVFSDVSAAYTENTNNTFIYYEKELTIAAQNLESEYRLNGTVSSNSIQNIKNLVQAGYDRLPDNGEAEKINGTLYRGTITALDLARNTPNSQTHVSNAISQVYNFISSAEISKITGTITANPISGNAPLTVSFLASNVIDPSGVSPSPNNYIWWMREEGGYRRELRRGPTYTHVFSQEGTYQIFLDVVSGSKNKKQYTDILPLSISQEIQVKPKLGEIILLVNGVNISNVSQFKINPTIGKMGIIFDATASRAISNGTIKKTKWDFGNGNVLEYNGGPIIEKQIYANEGSYKATLEIETNEGTIFRKDINLIIVDPAATISTDKTLGYIGEDFSMKAVSYFGNPNNVVYTWTVLNASSTDSKPLITQSGPVFNYKFPKVGDYIVTLMSRSPNGNEDRDSKTITIESHDPFINLDEPKPVSNEKPNTILFDASRSYDPDTMSMKDLTYKWNIDGNDVSLDNIAKDGAQGTYVFTEKGIHTVSVTVTNKYGKVKTLEKQFNVASTLSVNMNIVPRAAPLGTLVSFQAISPRAVFYEWNPGDGSPSINGQMDNIDHTYKKTGIYSATLTVKSADGSETNTIERKVYVTDANSPFALIDISNSSNTAIFDPDACSQDGAYIINRAEGTTIDGSNSVNVDGTNANLTYTWKYLDRVKTGPTLSEKFTELGCFPVELTVKSSKNGATHTSKAYIQIKNIAPKLTAVSTKIDPNKKDSQKVIVNVSADGVRDDDGVVTSYIWFYKTESDNEPQNIRITQTPSTTFVLPNITEKYTFGMILEDNDGARTNSTEAITEQAPLLIANENGNVNIPLITLNTSKTQVIAGESVDFVISAKTIVGADITGKSEYQWDFNGDGKIDKKTTEARVSYTYPTSGTYTAKVKVTHNGTSNSKYQNIVVKNELKARVQGYRTSEAIYLINASHGSYDTALWQIGDIQSESLYSISLPNDIFESGSIAYQTRILTVNAGSQESSSIEIKESDIMDISSTLSGGVHVQSIPELINDTVTISSRGEKVLLALYGNLGTQFAIDTNTKVDSDTNGTPDDDADNKEYPSYIDGSVFVIDTTDIKSREQTIKVQILKNGTVVNSREIRIIASFIPDTAANLEDLSTGSGYAGFSERDKVNLEKLQAKIRGLESDDRIILTQNYNSLIENWDDSIERTKKLIDIQEEVMNSSGISESDKNELSSLIDTILVGDANATDEITVATRVIESLIPADNPNRSTIISHLESIKSHPNNLVENKRLGSEILTFIKDDSSIEDRYKLIIKSQLQVITSGGQESVTNEEIPSTETSGGIMSFIKGTVLVFGFVISIIGVIILIGFIIYRISRKKEDMGFQDFLIDSIFHAKSHTSPADTKPSAPVPPVNTPSGNFLIEKAPDNDPLNRVEKEEKVQDPMAVFTNNTVSTVSSEEEKITPENTTVDAATIPDWLKPQSAPTEPPIAALTDEVLPTNPSSQSSEFSEEPSQDTSMSPDTLPEQNPIATSQEDNSQSTSGDIPDWLKGSEVIAPSIEESTEKVEDNISIDTSRDNVTDISENSVSPTEATSASGNTATSGDLPDWLVNSVSEVNATPSNKKSAKTKKKVEKPKKDANENNNTQEEATTDPTTQSSASANNTSPEGLPDWLK